MSLRDDALLAADARLCPFRRDERSGCQKARCVRFRADVYLSECVENIRHGVCARPARPPVPKVDPETAP
jgi:hypothetical protein